MALYQILIQMAFFAVVIRISYSCGYTAGAADANEDKRRLMDEAENG